MSEPIPTPRSDAAEHDGEFLNFDQERIENILKLARALERELAVAEEALELIAAPAGGGNNLSKWDEDCAKDALRRLTEMRREKGTKV